MQTTLTQGGAGPQPAPHVEEELTETEWAILSAYRQGRDNESDWGAYHQSQAWWFIHQMTAALLKGESEDEVQGFCDPEQAAALMAAARASAGAIRFLVEGWEKRRAK